MVKQGAGNTRDRRCGQTFQWPNEAVVKLGPGAVVKLGTGAVVKQGAGTSSAVTPASVTDPSRCSSPSTCV